MNHILYIYFGILAAASSVVSWKLVDLGPKPRSRLDSLEIEEILSKLKRARTNSVDMDYFGESVERGHPSQRTSVETSDSERQSNPFTERNPIVVYLDDLNVDKYQRKKVKVHRSSSSDDDKVSYTDVLQFLIQVDARLKEQEGRQDQYSHENSKLIDLIRDFRRVNEEDSSDDANETVEQAAKSKEDSKERVFTPRRERRFKSSSEERSPRQKQERIYSEEKNNKPRKEKDYRSKEERVYKPRIPAGKSRFASAYKGPPKFNFMRTPKPFLGKRGIYEEN